MHPYFTASVEKAFEYELRGFEDISPLLIAVCCPWAVHLM
jgi:hypothetical protein